MRGREPSETRFRRGVEIRGFNQIKKNLRQVTRQNKPYYFSEKKFLVLGALQTTKVNHILRGSYQSYSREFTVKISTSYCKVSQQRPIMGMLKAVHPKSFTQLSAKFRSKDPLLDVKGRSL